jgi:hypothetical protein
VRCANRNSACHTHCMKIIRSWPRCSVAVLGLLIFFVAAQPAARAQIVPVSLVHGPAEDSKVPSGVTLASLPPLLRSEPRRAVIHALPKTFFVLSAFLRLPAPAYYASATLFATGINFLGAKMVRSERWHKIWWIPQIGSMAGNLAGYGYTRAHPGSH